MENIAAAIYCRLSQDDGNAGESNSIQTQKALIKQYCAENNIPIAGVYCDDGWSGTNFERPQFKQMMEDIEDGKINMVIVKDLSRFGREYAQMGLYIEHYFEEKGVRFISIAENYDSQKGSDNLVLPFTNVINSYYTRQVSAKTKAAHRARAKEGMFLGAHAPFGYDKDPNDRHKLIIDPPAAEVVQMIFNLFADGVGYVKMTKILREKKILNPQAYFNRNHPDYYEKDYWRKDFDWHATSIRSILDNPVYIGDAVFGRTRTKGFFDKRREKVPKKDWIVYKNAHPAIISQELWDTVHQMMNAKRRPNVKGELQPFAGLVKCADCGSSLNVSFDKKRGVYTGFSCWVYKNYSKERCSSHYISWNALYQIVLENIRSHANIAQSAEDQYLEILMNLKTDQQKQDVKKIKVELQRIEKRLSEVSAIIKRLYEDLALGRINEERYDDMYYGLNEEEKELKNKQKTLQKELDKTSEVFQNVEKFIPLIRKYTDIQELNAYILNELIERIVVHEKTIGEDGKKTQKVEIYYKFVGVVEIEEGSIKEADR